MSGIEHHKAVNLYHIQQQKTRFWIIISGILLLLSTAGLVIFSLRGTMDFFRTPSEITEDDMRWKTRIRLGGYVKEGMIKRAGTGVRFHIADLQNCIEVYFNGVLPDLFREGQGVIAEGFFDENGVFMAVRVLAKHDEKYAPKVFQ